MFVRNSKKSNIMRYSLLVLPRKSVSISLNLDSRKIDENGKMKVRIQLSFERKINYFPTGVSLTKSELDKVNDNKFKDNYLRDLYINIEQWFDHAQAIVKELGAGFSVDKFRTSYYMDDVEEEQVDDNLFDMLDHMIKTSDISVGTKSSYEQGMISLKKFHKSKSKHTLRLHDVTPEWLTEYQAWFFSARKKNIKKLVAKSSRHKGSYTTVRIYLSPLRKLLLKALDDELITKKQYPFGKYKYKMPISQSSESHRALSSKDLTKMLNYKLEEGALMGIRRAYNYWIFSYLCNGINLKDILNLTQGNLKKDFVLFSRQKTAGRNNMVIKAVRLPLMNKIIHEMGKISLSGNDYVFPEYDNPKYATDEERLNRSKSLCGNITIMIRKIAEKAGVHEPETISFYSARHSFATKLMREGFPIEYISKALGHDNIIITQTYLAHFEDEVKLEAAQSLLKENA